MSDFLTIASIAVPVQAFSDGEPDRIGDEGRTYSGVLYSQQRSTKARWTATSGFLTSSEYATLKTAVANDAQVTVVRDLGGVTTTITARVRHTADLDPSVNEWVVRLDIREA